MLAQLRLWRSWQIRNGICVLVKDKRKIAFFFITIRSRTKLQRDYSAAPYKLGRTSFGERGAFSTLFAADFWGRNRFVFIISSRQLMNALLPRQLRMQRYTHCCTSPFLSHEICIQFAVAVAGDPLASHVNMTNEYFLHAASSPCVCVFALRLWSGNVICNFSASGLISKTEPEPITDQLNTKNNFHNCFIRATPSRPLHSALFFVVSHCICNFLVDFVLIMTCSRPGMWFVN